MSRLKIEILLKQLIVVLVSGHWLGGIEGVHIRKHTLLAEIANLKVFSFK